MFDFKQIDFNSLLTLYDYFINEIIKDQKGNDDAVSVYELMKKYYSKLDNIIYGNINYKNLLLSNLKQLIKK